MKHKRTRKPKLRANGYMPIDIHEFMWTNWIHQFKKDVLDNLDRDFQGWKEEGIKVIRIEIKEL